MRTTALDKAVASKCGYYYHGEYCYDDNDVPFLFYPSQSEIHALQLIPQFNLSIYRGIGQWMVYTMNTVAKDSDLKTAICNCVVKLEN